MPIEKYHINMAEYLCLLAVYEFVGFWVVVGPPVDNIYTGSLVDIIYFRPLSYILQL